MENVLSKILEIWLQNTVKITNIQELAGGYVNKVFSVKFQNDIAGKVPSESSKSKNEKQNETEVIVRMRLDEEELDGVIAEYNKVCRRKEGQGWIRGWRERKGRGEKEKEKEKGGEMRGRGSKGAEGKY
jgi:hypothetical protein